MLALYNLIDGILSLFTFLIFMRILFEWLVIFGIINTHNAFISRLSYFLFQITEPAFRLIRNFISQFFSPIIGGVDISPIILIMLIWFIRDLLGEYWFKMV